MQGYFVTGTGTGVGKTYIATRLLRHWLEQGVEARAYKPVESGIGGRRPEDTDAGQLLLGGGRPVNIQTIEGISPWRFRAPVSPDIAALREGRELNIQHVAAFCRRQMGGRSSVTLIEGAGGVMSPMDPHHTNLDLIDLLDIPAILVAGNYLGSISHTLTALSSLRQYAIPVAALVVNGAEDGPMGLGEHTTILRGHVGDIPVCAISHDANKGEIALLASLVTSGLMPRLAQKKRA